MKKQDALRYFESEYKIAKALGINQSVVSRWRGRIPMHQAWRLHLASSGKLIFDPHQYTRK